jgi:hypothetical protein
MKVFILAATLMVGPQLNGTVLFSNYDPTSTTPFNEPGFAIGQVGDPTQQIIGNYEWATAFTVSAPARLSLVTLALSGSVQTTGPDITVTLHGMDLWFGYPVPGAMLESWLLNTPQPWQPSSSASSLSVSLLSKGNIILLPGTTYWISASAPSSTDYYSYEWYDYPNQICCMLVARRVNGAGDWEAVYSTGGTLQVAGTPVPEPSTQIPVLLLLAGLALLSGRSRIRRCAAAGHCGRCIDTFRRLTISVPLWLSQTDTKMRSHLAR